MTTRLGVVTLVALSACLEPSGKLTTLNSFQVAVSGVYVRPDGVNRQALNVVTRCSKKYGSQAAVPAAVRGTKDCRYVIPTGEVEIDLTATALSISGASISFDGPVSFKVVPGDLAANVNQRWAQMTAGQLTATVHALHQYGPVTVWVQDAPPTPVYDAGYEIPNGLTEPPTRTFATGVAPTVYFDDQTLQSLQNPGMFDNRSSPFVGEFVVVGKNPESGETLTQSCEADPQRDGVPAQVVVTGLDPSGFYVTDVSACRLVEVTSDSAGVEVRTPEPPETCLVTLADGGTTAVENVPGGGTGTCAISQKSCTKTSGCTSYLPGTYAHMFIYNYNYPDGLDEGDLLFTLSGSVQEFTSTTQMVFPAWSIAEHVRTLPQDQWNKWEQYAQPTPVSYRLCGMDNNFAPFLTDALCGHNKRNLKMESNESGLVKLRNVRMPTAFDNCDYNADGTVPFFCEQKDSSGTWIWGSCAFGTVEPDADRKERECFQACVIGTGKHAGQLCAEESSYKGYGQYVVELGPPGLAAAGLDESDPARSVYVTLTAGGAGGADGLAAGQDVAIACTTDAHYKVGTSATTAGASDPAIAANTWTRVTMPAGTTSVAFLSSGAAGTCTAGPNSLGRILLYTVDAVPQLTPDCSPTDPDSAKATQCQLLQAATYDIIGHLKQVQPARPRWMVVPRYADDVCCHPGPTGQCPTPLKVCK